MLANRGREHARPDVVVAARPGEECGAAAPSGIPARGWREALRRPVLRGVERRLLGEAAAVAFYALLAAFPAMAALVWLCGLLADSIVVDRVRDAEPSALPAGAAEVAGELLG